MLRIHDFTFKVRIASLGVFFAASLLLVAACGPREPVVHIAVAAPMTGDLATEGLGLKRAVELAVEEANAAKRFPFRLKVVPLDDRADPREAVNVANLAVLDPRMIAVIGHYNSGCALVAARVYATVGMPMIVPSATNPEVTRQQLVSDWPGPRMVFRMVPTDDLQGVFAADFVFNELGKRRMAVLNDHSTYGLGLATEFSRAFARLSGKSRPVEAFSDQKRDFEEIINLIKAQVPDGVFFGGPYTEAGLLVRAMRDAGLNIPFISGDGAKTPRFFDVAGEAADGAYLSTVGIPVENLPAAQDFVEKYRRRWTGSAQGLKPFDHFAYEAVQILFAAMDKAGKDRPRIVSELARTRYEGILGTTTFDEKGDTRNHIISMTRARYADRSFEIIK